MDPNETYRLWTVALLEEDAEAAKEHYNALRAWMERGGFEPAAFHRPTTRRQFFQFNQTTGRLD